MPIEMGPEPGSPHLPPSAPSLQDRDPGRDSSGVWAAAVAAQALHTGRKHPSTLTQAHLFEGLYLQTYTLQISDSVDTRAERSTEERTASQTWGTPDAQPIQTSKPWKVPKLPADIMFTSNLSLLPPPDPAANGGLPGPH